MSEDIQNTDFQNTDTPHNQKIGYWLDLSRYDLETAEVMMEGKKFLYVGFMCHQAIEKTLKAFYVMIKNDNPPYIHNLRRLAKQCEIYDQFSDEQKDLIDRLNPLNIEARYPTYKENLLKSLTSEKCGDTISKTKELHKWIKQILLKMLSEK